VLFEAVTVAALPALPVEDGAFDALATEGRVLPKLLA